MSNRRWIDERFHSELESYEYGEWKKIASLSTIPVNHHREWIVLWSDGIHIHCDMLLARTLCEAKQEVEAAYTDYLVDNVHHAAELLRMWNEE